MVEIAMRKSAHESRFVERPTVRIIPAGPARRLSLRAPSESVKPLSKALGLALPDRPKTSAQKNGRAALWLGPDEWLVIDQTDRDPVADCAGVSQFHSAVDISHRNVGIIVSGPGAEATLAAGCPQDISLASFPVGACSRTVLHKVEIVLWRTGPEEFRVECWRSFADYAFTLLAEASRDATV